MIILIEQATAKYGDMSTLERKQFKLNHWTIEYVVLLDKGGSMSGKLQWNATDINYEKVMAEIYNELNKFAKNIN